MVRLRALTVALLSCTVALTTMLSTVDGAVELSYEIVDRPEAVRPIPGEVVEFTCTVQGSVITWNNEHFQNPLTFVRNSDGVGAERFDTPTNASIVLSDITGSNFTAVLTFNSVQGDVHNNTAVECSNTIDSSNITIVMAGIPSPPVDPVHFNNTCTCANISWDLPEFDGDAVILSFTVTLTVPPHTLPNSTLPIERIETAPGNATSLDICELVPNAVYNTTITADNAVGSSRAEEILILIEAIEPYPALNLATEPVCDNHRLCHSGHLLVTWDLPPQNSLLLCPVKLVWLNYSFVELEVVNDSFAVNVAVTATSYEITPISPGTTYTLTVSFVNEVGESVNNTVAIQDVLLFQSFLFQKQSSPNSILEGHQSVYTVKLDGPPPNDVSLELAAADNLIRVLTSTLVFNSSNWFVSQDIYVVGVDDDIIRPSPYHSFLKAVAPADEGSGLAATNVTLLVTELDGVSVLIVPKETYPYPPDIPEGRWAVYEVTLPNQPYHPVTITFHTLTSTIALSPEQMTFDPDAWNISQYLTVFAREDEVNMESPYMASFNMSLVSMDDNYDGADVGDFNVTLEDNDEDAAILSGSLTWIKEADDSRTTAQLLLTLTLTSSLFPNASVGGAVYINGGVLDFGDGLTYGEEGLEMEVLSVNAEEDYILATSSILHSYPTANYYGRPWMATFQYCCRGKALANNMKTKLVLSVDVDLTFTSSPLLPTLPPVTLHSSLGPQGFFLTSTHPNSHPFTYSLGDAFDYHSAQAGAPQGVSIFHTTGHVTWDTTHVSPGDYSVMVVVEDVVSGVRTVCELLLRVKPSTANTPPTLPSLTPLLPPPPLHFTINTTTTHTLTVHDEDTIMGADVDSISPLPEGAALSGLIITGAYSGEVQLSWSPAEDQEGVYTVCVVARNMHSVLSTPLCLPLIVSMEMKELPILDSNGPLENGTSYHQTFTKGVDQSVPIVADDATISLPPSSPFLHYMSVAIAGYLNGSNEAITLATPTTPSLSYHSSEPSADAPATLYFEGIASPDVYLDVLKNLRYENFEDRPSVGQRVVYVVLFDGEATNDYTLSFTTIDVSIHNIAPVLSVSGSDGESFEVRYFPMEGPVPAVDPIDTYVVDTDSVGIEGATLQLNNVQDGAEEVLRVTYESPEALSVPVIAEVYNLDIPFGVLWRGEEVPSINSTITVEGGHPGDVVGEVSVVIDVRHSWVGDLKIELEHNSRRELLVLSPGGQTCQRDDLFRTTFSSNLNSGLYLSKSAQSPGLCVFQAQGVFTPDGNINSFQASPVNGEWTLHLTDTVLDSHNGRLVGWSVAIQPLETHLTVNLPPVVPLVHVSGELGYEERHLKQVSSDGRITRLAVHVHLGVPFTAKYAYLPTLSLVHPDGTRVLLTDGSRGLCAIGNYTHLVLDDRAQPTDYSCSTLIAAQGASGSGSALSIEEMMLSSAASSGSASGSGLLLTPEDMTTLDDVMNMSISIPTKKTLVDPLTPVSPLSALVNKQIGGEWALILSSTHPWDSTLIGWSLKIAREPNINPSYDTNTNTLTLSGTDSPENYQAVLRSIVYENTASDYEFLTQRTIQSTVFDGELYSNATARSATTYLIIHHIVLDLDPAQISSATTPNFSVDLVEHGSSIAVLNPQYALLADEAFSAGQYTLTVTLREYLNYEEEGLTVDVSVAPELQAEFENDTTSNEFTVTITSVNSTLQPIQAFQAVLRTVEYYNYAEEFVGSSRTVEFTARDTQNGSLFISRVATANISLIHTNDLPVLLLNSFQYDTSSPFSNIIEYEEGLGPLPLANASSVLLTDNDHNSLENLTIRIENPQDGDMEILSADTAGSSITAAYNSSTNVLILSGMDSLENYTRVIGTVTYENTVHSPGQPGTEPRWISFVPFDGTHSGQAAIALVTFAAVNDAPFGDLNGPALGTNFTATFTEEEGMVSIASQNLTLFDIDNTTLAFITVQITNAHNGLDESLSVMDVTEQTDPDEKIVTHTNLRPNTSYDAASATLTITGLDTVREYQEVLKTLVYNNIADEPNNEMRVVEIILSDGSTEGEPLYILVEIELVNDSPYFDLNQQPYQPEILEDLPVESNAGVPLSDLAYLIADSDVGAQKGIAIVQIDSHNGTWEYSIDSGMNWIPIDPDVNMSHALVFQTVEDQRVRFRPHKDYNGYVDTVIVAWDGSDGTTTAGSYISAVSQSDIDPFSSQSLPITLTVIPVNDAPVLLSIPLNMTPILEDDYNSTGDTVLSLLAHASDVDVDSSAELGIAVIAADQSNGWWQYTTDGGQTWEGFGSVDISSALLLQSLPAEKNRVRFVPDMDYNGYASFHFLVWDLTRLPEDNLDLVSTSGSGVSSSTEAISMTVTSASGSGSGGSGLYGSGDDITSSMGIDPVTPNITLPEPYPSGSYINTSLSDAITGPFSVNSTSVTQWVEPVNDSPVIYPGMTLHSIHEKLSEDMNHGTEVSNIILPEFYNDVDANRFEGLAVIEVDNRNGEWQYSCNFPADPSSWEPFIGDMYYGQIVPPLPRPEKATLLLSSCWIRFLPHPYFNNELNTDGYPRPATDAPYIRAYGWDNTGNTFNRSGTYGNDATYAAESSTNEYSMVSEQIFITVTSVNDVPILHLTNDTVVNYETVFLEDLYPVDITGEGLTLIDNDHARLRDVTVTIYGSEFENFPLSHIDFDSYSTSGSGVSSGSGSGSTSGSGSGSESGSTSASGSGISGSGSGSGGGLQLDTDNTSTTAYIPMVTSAPDLPPLHQVQEYVQNLPNPTYLQRYCAGMEPRREELFIDVSRWDLQYEVLSWCPFTLYIFADPAFGYDAPKEQFALALRTLQYNNSIEEPEGGYRTIGFVVSDNYGVSDTVNASVFVQPIDDSPVLNLNTNVNGFNNFVAYREGQGPLVLANMSALYLYDNDNTYLQYARIELHDPPNRDNETLNATITSQNIIATYENYTLTLTGNATVLDYAQVLATVTYENTYAHPGMPSERERQVYFYVSDGEEESDPAIAIISFTGVNDQPHLYVNGFSVGNYEVNFFEEKGPVVIVHPNLVLHDEDNSSIAYITARITNNRDGPLEFLAVDRVVLEEVQEQNMNDQDKVIQVTHLIPNVTYNDATAELYITGLDSIDEYFYILRNITYDNVADEPDTETRIIEFIVNDGLLDSVPVNTLVNITLVNDSPRFNDSVSIISPLILEDDTDNMGTSVFEFAYLLIEDDDNEMDRGIAIIAVDTENGHWEYMAGTGSGWTRIADTTNITRAVLLRAEVDNFVRFVPKQDFNGNTSMTFIPWDATDLLPDGGVRVAVSMNGTDSLGEETMDLVIQVIAVNDAPVLNTSVQPQMTPILEDDVWERESYGDEVSVFLVALLRDVDVESLDEQQFGIAITAADISNGRWEISVDGGMNWTDIGSPSPSSAVVLHSQPAGENRIRFVPNPDYNGQSSFQYVIWDMNTTWPSGNESIDTTAEDPVTGTFSNASTTAHIVIEPVNDSPVLVENGGLTLTAIDEDEDPLFNSGTSVSRILRDHYDDIDGPAIGVAVVYVDERNGRWVYMCDTSTTWLDFIGGFISYDTLEGPVQQISPRKPNEFSATLLDEDCSIRFLPNENFNTQFDLDGNPRDLTDTPYILLRGWDQTEGTSLERAVNTSTTPDDHTNAFSTNILPATIEVHSVADPPILQLSGENNYETTFVEPIPPERRVVPVPVVDSSLLRLTDVDNAMLSFVVVTFETYDGSHESLSVNLSDTGLVAIFSSTSSSMSLQLEPEGSALSAPIESFEAALRTIEYQNTVEEPSTDDRSITFLVSEGGSVFGSLRTTTLRIQLTNDPPELDLNTGLSDSFSFVGYSEGDGALPLLNLVTVDLLDYDDIILDHARVTITDPHDMEREVLDLNWISPNISATFNESQLLLQGPASVEEFRNAISSVTYENTFADPGDPSGLNRTIEFVVNDGTNDSIPAFAYVLFTVVNNAPFLDLNGGDSGLDYSTTFYEEQDPASVVSQNLTIQDIDNTTLAFIEVTITNPCDGGQFETLWVEDVTVTSAPLDSKHVTFWNYRPTQYYNETTTTLTITGLDTVEEYQEVLKTLKYDNVADEPHNERRRLLFTISDGLLSRTDIYSYVDIANINDSPYFNESATLFSSEIEEDVHDQLNPGWAVEDIVAGLILDDDEDSQEGIAIVAVDSSNGHWEITWDYSAIGSTVDLGGSGSGSGSGIEPVMPSSGGMSSASGMQVSSSGMANSAQSGEGSAQVDSGSAVLESGSGSGLDLGLSGSGINPLPPEDLIPKCLPTTRTPQVSVEQMFSANWHRLPSNTSITQAVVLRADNQKNRIRFVPRRDFNGEASFSFVAWDTTNANGLRDGTETDAMSTSAIDPYSSEVATISIEVLPVNDAPVLTPNIVLNLTSILEDDYDSYGDDVGDLTGIITDVDTSDTEFGIAIIFADEDNGRWEASTDGGSSWNPMINVCPYNATVLSSQPFGENRVRFVPNKDFNGEATFVFLAWDLTSYLQSGDMGINVSAADIVTGPFSVNSTTVTIIVEPVNDSPVLSSGSYLSAILEDTPEEDNNGTSVANIVRGQYYDVDVGAEIGIAVVGVDLRYGIWQYWCPNVPEWSTFIGNVLYGIYIVPPNPQVDKATLLAGDCQVRFLPNDHFNTLLDINGHLWQMPVLPFITIRAWDNTGLTEGLSGQYGIDTTYNTESITNEFSSETEVAVIEVISVNDITMVRIAEEGDGLSFHVSFTENQPYVRIVQPEAVSLADIDHTELESVTITVTNSIDEDAEMVQLKLLANPASVSIDNVTNTASVTINGTTQEIMLNYTIFSASSPSPSSLTMFTPFGRQKASIETYEELLRYVVYTNLLEEPTNVTRDIRFDVNDSEDVAYAHTTVQIELVNDHIPVITDSLTEIDFVEDTAEPVPIASANLTVTDTDHNEYFFISNASVVISPVPETANETVSVNLSVVFDQFSLIQSYDPSTGVLKITGDAPPIIYQSVLQTAVYQNTIEETRPGMRTITMQVFDGDHYSNVHTVSVNVILLNDQNPVITTANDSFVFVERSEPISISHDLTVTDADSGEEFQILSSITINITNAHDDIEEQLSVTPSGNVSTTFSGTTLNLWGPAHISEFQQTLSSLTYVNLAEEPVFGERIISLVADDGMLTSQVVYIRVMIELVNDLPVIDLNGPSSPGRTSAVNYIEGLGEVVLSPNATLMDNDHQHLLMLTAKIIYAPDGPSEVLSVTYMASGNESSNDTFSLVNTTTEFNITVDYDSNSSLLVLSGHSSIENYQTLLQTIAYDNYKAMPGFPNNAPRTIEIQAYDGVNYSNPAHAMLTFHSINDPPILDLNGAVEGNHSVEFIEEGEPVILADPDLVLVDVDNTFMAYVQVTIMNVLDGSDEVLAVDGNYSVDQFANYEGGTLFITGLGEVENFRSALASVTYQNLADEPSYDTRVISVVANDGEQDSSVQYVEVNITAVNDPPRLIITGGQRTSPPPVTATPTEEPTSPSVASGDTFMSASGSGDQSGSGIGIDPLSGSGMGLDQLSGSGSGSGIGLDFDSGSGSGSGDLETNDTTASMGSGSGTNTTQPPTSGSGFDTSSGSASGSGMDIMMNLTTNMTTPDNYSITYIENSLPLSIVDPSGVLIEDDDDAILSRLEVILNGVLDPGKETIFFDINLLSINLRNSFATGGYVVQGYLGDGTTCPPGVPFTQNSHTILDVSLDLDILQWEEVVRSLKYCHSDDHPIGGTRNVTFRIQDPSGAWSDTQITLIDVIAENDAPVCNNSLSNEFQISEDMNVTVPALSNCFDFEEDLVGTLLQIHRYPELGTVSVVEATGEIVYIPALNDYGTRSFAYVACDRENLCSQPQNVTILISPVNDIPFPAENLILFLTEDTPQFVKLDQFFGDIEDDLDEGLPYPRVQTTTGFNAGSVSRNGTDPVTYLFEPSINFEGQSFIILDVCDSEGACINITLEIVVLPVNDEPTIEVQYEGGSPPAYTNEDTPLRIEIAVFDVEDREELNVSIVSVRNGTAVPDRSEITNRTVAIPGVSDLFQQTMHVNYTPNVHFYGTDYITVAAVDSEGRYGEGVITVEVEYVNDPPEFGRTQLTVVEDEVTQFTLPSALQITDPEEDLHAGSFTVLEPTNLGNITYTFDEGHLNMTGTFPETGSLTYYPPEHFFTSENETVTFVLQACDNDSVTVPLCTNETIHITILSDNDAPHLPVVPQSVYEDGFLSFNLSDFTYDVEDGKPPIENIFLTEPYPTKGVAVYNTSTGFLHYTPNLNAFGEDIVHYNACDSEYHCSTVKGQVVVNILEVNDPPEARDFLHIAREDDFDLIGFYRNITDNETTIAGLRIGIRSETYSSTREYVDEWTTPIGAQLRVYHAHQIITYAPPPDFVGLDSFTYSVCDPCDVRRDEELGRVDAEPHCTRQLEENSGSLFHDGSDVYITCAEAEITVRVVNINDVPQALDLAGVTQTGETITFSPFDDSLVSLPPSLGTGYLYSDSTAVIYDADDMQALTALSRGDNLTLYNLDPVTDLNETSLVLKSDPTNGKASMFEVDGRVRVEYSPTDDFGGYDEFLYEICDLQRGVDPPRCSEAAIRVFVTRVGPEIGSLVANGLTINPAVYADCQVSRGDVITITFSEDTNMPPYGNNIDILSTFDVDQIFQFDPPFLVEPIVQDGYYGQWDSPSRFNLTIRDEGYPQPFIFNTASRLYSEIKIGEWKVMVRPNTGPCGGFDSDGQLIGAVNRYCLLSADTTSQHSGAVSPTLTGNFGLRLPELKAVLIENVAVDDSILENNQVEGVFLKSHIILRVIEPLSYAQLQLYCNRDPSEILDTSRLADSITMIVDGCTNILPDGQNANQVYEDNIAAMNSAFSTSKRKRSTEESFISELSTSNGNEAETLEKRQISSIPLTVLPAQSEVVLQIQSITNPLVDPTTDPQGFARLVYNSINYGTIASVIEESLGIPAGDLMDYRGSVDQLVTDPYFYYSYDDDLTPNIEMVVANDPDDEDQLYGSGDTITIYFDRDTDQPAVSQKSDLDRIFIFDPPLGTNYGGDWLDARTLEITIHEIESGASNYPSAAIPGPVQFSLSFMTNYFHTGDPVVAQNDIVPTETPWCVGINVCGSDTTDGSEAQSVGICSANQLSCRAHETWTDLDGDFGTGDPEPPPPFPWWWILVAIIVVIIIAVLVVVFYFLWRKRSQRARAKEARRVITRWKEDRFAPGKEERRKEEGQKPWQGPPAPSAMRSLPDPFAKGGVLNKLPEVVPRPPTAITELENLPPIPHQPPASFKPRTPARIQPPVPGLQSVPVAPRSRTLSSPASLPPQLGLPPLSRLPPEQTTPSRVDRRTVLPPVKGGLVSLQARKALHHGPEESFGATSAAMPDLPHRLPPLSSQLYGPTSMPDRPLHVLPLERTEGGKGKGPASGKLLPKKGSPPSSQEDIAGEDSDVPKPKPVLPTLAAATRPLPPPFQTTRPLPPIGGTGRALPPIGGRPPLSTLPSISPATSMPPRRTAPDPFATSPTGTTKPPWSTTASVAGPLSPGKITPVPLGSLRSPPTRPTLSPTKSPTKITRSPPVPTSSSVAATKTPKGSGPPDDVPESSAGGQDQT